MFYQVTTLFSYAPPHTRNPKATVDYHQTQKIVPLEAGQVVARLEKTAAVPEPGSAAWIVSAPEELLTPKLELVADENGFKLVSRQKGFPRLQNKRIYIDEYCLIEGDINFRTSNLECDGELLVTGSIMAGFRVTADCLTVQGNIENAEIECRGNLICLGGIIACQKRPIMCHGSIWCKYLENSLINARGNIFIAKSSLHSHLKAGENIILCHHDAVLVGGRCECGHSLFTAVLGARWATPTEIILGCNPFLAQKHTIVSEELAKLESEQEELQERIEQINIYLQQKENNQPTPGEIHQLQEERELNEGKIGVINSRRQKLQKKCQALEQRITAHKENCDRVFLAVTYQLYSGVQLTIKDTKIKIKEERKAVKLELNPENNNEIVAVVKKS